jgi:hypothetical protein
MKSVLAIDVYACCSCELDSFWARPHEFERALQGQSCRHLTTSLISLAYLLIRGNQSREVPNCFRS